jgi:hypothetical protein
LRYQQLVKDTEKKVMAMRLKWFEENYEKVFKNPALPPNKVGYMNKLLSKK